MTGNNQMNQDQDRLRQQQDHSRQDQPTDAGSDIGVQGEEQSFGAEDSREDHSESQGTSATLSPDQGGAGGGVENADFAASGGTREQNLGRSDQAGAGEQPEGGIQQDRG